MFSCRNRKVTITGLGTFACGMTELEADGETECQMVLDAEKLLAGLGSATGVVHVSIEDHEVTFSDSTGIFAMPCQSHKPLLPTLGYEWSPPRILPVGDLQQIVRLRSWCDTEPYRRQFSFVALRFFVDGWRAVGGNGASFMVIDNRPHPDDPNDAEATVLLHRHHLAILAAALGALHGGDISVRWCAAESQVALTWDTSCLLLRGEEWEAWPDERKFLTRCPNWAATFKPSDWRTQLRALDAATANKHNQHQVVTLTMNTARTALTAEAEVGGNGASRVFPLTSVSLAVDQPPPVITLTLENLTKLLAECSGRIAELHSLGSVVRVYPIVEKRARWMFAAQFGLVRTEQPANPDDSQGRVPQSIR